MADENGDVKGASTKDDAQWAEQIAADELAIARLLSESQNDSAGLKLDDTPFDQTNKADDAEDFEDISDDDLPDEEPSAGQSLEIPALTDDGGTSNDADDLFGEGASSPIDPILDETSPGPTVRDFDAADETQATDMSLNFAINFDPEPHRYGAANQDPDIPAPAETVEDLLKATWPSFEKGKVLTWSELLPSKRAVWKEKKPTKKPKHLVTSKLSLDLAPDDEKLFRIPGPAASSSKQRREALHQKKFVLCDEEATAKEREVEAFDLDHDSDGGSVCGFSLQDISLACEDWNENISRIEDAFSSQLAAESATISQRRPVEDADDEWDAEFLQDMQDVKPSLKRKRPIPKGLPAIPKYGVSSFDSFEATTKLGAKRVHLDLNDPHLLLETNFSRAAANGANMGDSADKRVSNSNIGRSISKRFNLSNDEAYDLLKENHQSKVRATIGLITMEHSLPADKLCWPFYKVKLPGTTDEYHRPRFRYRKFAGHIIRFEKPHHHKRKMMKGKSHDVFNKSKDLTLGDNATAVLMEYCEPRPRVLNGFGMGNKVINYYRRKDNVEEEQLPKLDLGEYRTLLPEDRSPFSLFGSVDSGETVPTLHNEMYRAPLFKHDPRKSDFLIVRNTTGTEGSHWFLRKIDHLHVVGQTFPAVEVPGPHSRKVTTTSKNRMKMLAYRMIRHSQNDNFNLAQMTKHIAESTDTQNRQKLKEFLQHDKDTGEKGMWKLRSGEALPDEAAIRAMIKPEDVCLQDAMQLGIKELEDAGYDPRNTNIDDDAAMVDEDEDDGDEEGSKAPKGAKNAEKIEETLADKLAPWVTTKAFIDACAHKAMLQLHGEGDPTGHGLGFSFMRTSMKGGYLEKVQGPLATSADAIEREKRANGGHAYNVKKQQAMYEEGIREIWDKQKSTLQDSTPHDDADVQLNEDEDDRFNVHSAATPAQFDDGVSQISGLTSASRHAKRAIRINREIRMPDGSRKTISEIVHDPVVISQYMKRRTEAELEEKEYVSPSSDPSRYGPPRKRRKHLHSSFSNRFIAPGSTMDLVGLEFKTPAYVFSSTASIHHDLRAMPTTTVLQAFGKTCLLLLKLPRKNTN